MNKCVENTCTVRICGYYNNEQISQNPRRVAHCRVSSLVLAIKTALLTRRQRSADHKGQVGVTVITE